MIMIDYERSPSNPISLIVYYIVSYDIFVYNWKELENPKKSRIRAVSKP